MKLLFFDIDGTLMSEKTGLIPKSAKKAIKKAQEAGHLVFINTGRPRSTIEDKILNLGLDGYVCGCGSYIELHGKILHSSALPHELCLEIVEQLKKCRISALLEGEKAVYYEKDNRHPQVALIKENYAKVGFDTTKTWDDKNICFDKATCWLNEDSLFEPFMEWMKKYFEPIKRAENFYEFIQPQYSKATGIQYLLNHFNLPLDAAYAFGDSTNDLSMLRYVNHSIGMQESHLDVLKTVSFITKDVDDDGIAYALEKLNLIKGGE